MKNHHRNINYVEEIKINDRIVKDNEQLRQVVKEFSVDYMATSSGGDLSWTISPSNPRTR